jgi:hypothetical protein
LVVDLITARLSGKKCDEQINRFYYFKLAPDPVTGCLYPAGRAGLLSSQGTMGEAGTFRNGI